jgi:hypothetical protein
MAKKKFRNKPKRQIDSFIKTFNADHKYTKIVGARISVCWVLDIKVLSAEDKRKSLCNFFCNVWPEYKFEEVSDTINNKYRGMREFLDQHDGLERQLITPKKEEVV